jgi:hypothetical protein
MDIQCTHWTKICPVCSLDKNMPSEHTGYPVCSLDKNMPNEHTGQNMPSEHTGMISVLL